MKFQKVNLKLVLMYVALFFVFLVLGNAQINAISPFLFAFFFACLFVGLNEKIIAAFTVSSALIVDFSLESFLISISVVSVGLISFYIHKVSKHKLHLLTNFVVYLISLATYIYYNYFDYTNLIFYILLGIVSLFVFTNVMQILILRKNCFQITLDETISFLFFVAVVGLSFANIEIFNVKLFRFVLMLAIFICLSMNSPTLTYAFSLSFSLGVSVGLGSLLPVAEFIALALISHIFSLPQKFKISFLVIIFDVFLQYYFFLKDLTLLYEVVPIVLACIVFVCIPNKLLNNFADVVYVKKGELSSRNLINSTRKSIKKRMAELSNVFLEMKQIHLGMVKKELTKEELIAMLCREVVSVCCKDCLEKNRCTRTLGVESKSNLSTLVEIAVNKGRITLLDIPSAMANRCGKVNNLVALINRISDEYKQYKNIMADVNNVKILLADQMGAVSTLLLDVGDEIDSNVKFDIAKENKIITRLLSLNIQCREVLLYTEKHDDLSAVLIVKSEQAYDPTIEKVLSTALKCPMQITKVTPIENGGFDSVILRRRSKYDCVFGLASCNKAGNIECGDCHSIIRLGRDRFLLALCDGMGSGKSAHKMSAMTLGLIENFYKAGFEHEVILESVNKLLAINNQENYSTLDICLLDLEKEVANFIKVGSPYGLIKRESNIEKIEGGALPIGALDSIAPSTYKTTISTKDIVIMATDGIMDAFEAPDQLIEFVSRQATNNPQVLADAILKEAMVLNNMSAKDDMTVLVARTFLKN